MITPSELAQHFQRNLDIIEAQTKGLSHQQCLLQPTFRANCMNWVLGHIAETRNSVCISLGQGPVMSREEADRYGHGSEPVCGDGPDVVRLERLLGILRACQERINQVLPLLSENDLAVLVKDHRGEVSLGNRLAFLYFHDTYHTGQTELLRQLAGTNDKVI